MTRNRFFDHQLSRRSLLRHAGTVSAGIALGAALPRRVMAQTAAPSAPGVAPLDLAAFEAANIDWQQFSGAQLSLVMLTSPPWTDRAREVMQAFEQVSGATVN